MRRASARQTSDYRQVWIHVKGIGPGSIRASGRQVLERQDDPANAAVENSPHHPLCCIGGPLQKRIFITVFEIHYPLRLLCETVPESLAIHREKFNGVGGCRKTAHLQLSVRWACSVGDDPSAGISDGP